MRMKGVGVKQISVPSRVHRLCTTCKTVGDGSEYPFPLTARLSIIHALLVGSAHQCHTIQPNNSLLRIYEDVCMFHIGSSEGGVGESTKTTESILITPPRDLSMYAAVAGMHLASAMY